MTDAFSTSASHAFEHSELPSLTEIEAGPSRLQNGDAVSNLSVEEAFEVEDTVHRILEGGYKTIGLQFPDELLPSSVPVFRAIQKGIQHTGAQAYVLADSTYGSCCPDVLSCLHLPADFLVHYGHACLTPTDALPVHYVFPRRSLSVAQAFESLSKASQGDLQGEDSKKGTIIVWDVAFDWLSEEIIASFSKSPYPISFATIQKPAAGRQLEGASMIQEEKSPSLRNINPPSGIQAAECVIWYLGEEGRSLVNLQMQHAECPIYSYTPTTSETTSHSSSRLLQRRLRSIAHAVSSDIFGLVVHSVGLRSSQQLLKELRNLIKAKRKKSYTLTVGRLNPAKLANFDIVECFVLVGCQEGGLVDSKDFLRPIITPWELVLALQGPEHPWQPSKWTLDIDTVLAEAKSKGAIRTNGHSSGFQGNEGAEGDEEDKDEEAPTFSLVDGTYKSRRMFGKDESEVNGAIQGLGAMTIRNKEFSLAKLESAGSHYLNSRSFQGLEPRYGEDEPSALEEGRSGIARGYTEEQ